MYLLEEFKIQPTALLKYLKSTRQMRRHAGLRPQDRRAALQEGRGGRGGGGLGHLVTAEEGLHGGRRRQQVRQTGAGLTERETISTTVIRPCPQGDTSPP